MMVVTCLGKVASRVKKKEKGKETVLSHVCDINRKIIIKRGNEKWPPDTQEDIGDYDSKASLIRQSTRRMTA